MQPAISTAIITSLSLHKSRVLIPISPWRGSLSHLQLTTPNITVPNFWTVLRKSLKHRRYSLLALSYIAVPLHFMPNVT